MTAIKLSQAHEIGVARGRQAATWLFASDTPSTYYRWLLIGIEQSDPAVLGKYEPPCLSGEWAEDYARKDIVTELDLDEEADTDLIETCCREYEHASGIAFWAEAERRCREYLEEPVETCTTCEGRMIGNVFFWWIGAYGVYCSQECAGDDLDGDRIE